MVEKDNLIFSKSLNFEGSGETLKVTIELVNISPESMGDIKSSLDVLYKDLKKVIYFL